MQRANRENKGSGGGPSEGRPARTSSTMSGHSTKSGFDFTAAIRDIVFDMTERLPALSHIDPTRVAFSFAQTRSNSQYGTYASLTPLRFENGSKVKKKSGRKWAVQPVRDEQGREMLYILTVYLPRFQNLTFNQKLTTIVHELFHISPHCDGDLRRFGGRCYAHTGSQKKYDAAMAHHAAQWLAMDPPAELYSFLELDFSTLAAAYGRVHGTKVAAPKSFAIG